MASLTQRTSHWAGVPHLGISTHQWNLCHIIYSCIRFLILSSGHRIEAGQFLNSGAPTAPFHWCVARSNARTTNTYACRDAKMSAFAKYSYIYRSMYGLPSWVSSLSATWKFRRQSCTGFMITLLFVACYAHYNDHIFFNRSKWSTLLYWPFHWLYCIASTPLLSPFSRIPIYDD